MTAYNKNQPESIQAMFGSIAEQYDRTNSVLSFQMHKRWNQTLVDTIIQLKGPSNHSNTLADLCCGTGEIAFAYLKKSEAPCSAYLIDFCEQMLTCARQKANHIPFARHQLTYIQADVKTLPLTSESIDCATMAYGIRNVKEPAICLQEVFRVLKPGGVIGILELTEPTHPLLRFSHQLYLRTVLPIAGKFLTSNREAYHYLCNSIHTFIKPQDLQKILFEAGFQSVQIRRLHGGIATIISAQK